MIGALYSTGLALTLLGYAPVLAWRRLRGRGHPAQLAQRWGRIAEGLPPGPRAWVHAVSVGESLTAVPLVEGIRRRWPHLSIVMTTVTPTGARIVTERLGGTVTHRYFPLDLPGPVSRALRAVAPRFFISMETELWPNFLATLGARHVPVMVANGRISDRSYRRYRLVRGFMRRVLDPVTVFAMQSEEDARRIMALGAPPERVVVTGSLKADPAPEERGELWERLLGLGSGERLLVAGSTHRGEEEPVLDAFLALRERFAGLALLLAPRHPERVPEVERLVRSRGLEPVRRTALPRERRPGQVIVLDTVGELAPIYRVAYAVFVGGSLVPLGGHNMLEPALRLRPVLFGPHTENFRDSAACLTAGGGGLVVEDGRALEAALAHLLAEPELARQMGEAAYEAVASRQGAVSATLDLVERYLHPDGTHG
jgi:3-deoxy-D-manno-octulosonic-acid transferase